MERQTTFGADARRSGEERPGARRRQGAVGVSSARLQMLQSQYNDGFGGSAASSAADAPAADDASPSALAAARRTAAPARFMLHPYSPLRIRWDVFTSLVLLVTAFLTPLRVGFAIADSDDDAALFGVDRVMDATFLLDLLLNFRTGFHGASGDVVMEPRNVALNYVRGLLTFDLVATMPWELVYRLARPADAAPVLPGACEGDNLGSLLQLVDCVRLLRLLRLLRIYKRLEMVIGLQRSTRTVASFFVTVVVVAHWYACVFFLIGRLTLRMPKGSWASELCEVDALGHPMTSWWSQYIASLYWSFTMFTPGAGNVLPVNEYERLFSLLVMMTGAGVFTYGVTSIVQALVNKNKAQKEFYERLDELNVFMTDMRLPRELRRKFRDYFRVWQARRRARPARRTPRYALHSPAQCPRPAQDSSLIYDEKRLLASASPALAGEVVSYVHSAVLRRVPFFEGASDDCFIDIVMRLQQGLFVAGEVIFREATWGSTMFIIKKGIVAISSEASGSVARLTGGDHFGEVALVMHTKRVASAQAVNYVLCYVLEAADLQAVLEKYPDVRARVLQSAAARWRSQAKLQATERWGRLQRAAGGMKPTDRASRLRSVIGAFGPSSRAVAVAPAPGDAAAAAAASSVPAAPPGRALRKCFGAVRSSCALLSSSKSLTSVPAFQSTDGSGDSAGAADTDAPPPPQPLGARRTISAPADSGGGEASAPPLLPYLRAAQEEERQPLDDSCLYLTSVLQELQAHWRPREPQARNRLAQILNTIATEDDAQRQAVDTELTQLRTMIGSLQDSLGDFQKK